MRTTVHVAAGLLVEDGRVLLGHRSPSRRWYPDVWDLPGGHVEPGESSRDALDRELREEVGVTVLAARLHDRIHLEDVDLDVWWVTAWSGTPVNRCPEEHDAIAWFGPDDLPIADLAHPSYAALVRTVTGTA